MTRDAPGWGRGRPTDARRDALRRAKATLAQEAPASDAGGAGRDPGHDPERDPWSEPWDDEPRPPLYRRAGRGIVRLVTTLVIVCAIGALGFMGGAMLRYLDRVDGYAPPALASVARADAIAVLTGGSDRIAAAGRLLEAGRAERLLVSGVNEVTTEPQVRGLLGVGRDLFECCVTLGFKALDTLGNARETAAWVARVPPPEGERARLIVVTSNYHMERALVELRRVMPEVDLDPYPVRGVELDDEDWWQQAGTWRLLLGEFVKLQLARARDVPVVGERLAGMVRTPLPRASDDARPAPGEGE